MVLDEKEMESYNAEVYALKWLNAAHERLNSDYYKKDHYPDTLDTLARSRGKKVLECGIGTGEFFAIGLARSGKEVFGIDFSRPLLADCGERFRKEGYAAHLGMADARSIPFKDEVFDATYAIGVVPLVSDISAAIGEMVRVTTKGGLVLFDVMNLWHISQYINHLYKVVESTKAGFNMINFLKGVKRSMGLKTNFKASPEKVNHHLISPLVILRVLKGFPWRYRIKGYNVLMPIDMPILGSRANICARSPLFSRGLRDSRMLKYFGSKMVIVIEKVARNAEKWI